MHRRAEYGIAAHWGYKEKASAADIAWLQRLVDWQKDTTDPAEFLETLKLDLEQDEVFVFTPKGDVVTLPVGRHAGRLRLRDPHRGRPPLHRRPRQRPAGAARLEADVGRHGRGVHVEGRRTAGPSRDWLKIVASPRARNKIRQWFSRERREDAIDNGRDELMKTLRREGLPVQKLASSPLLLKLAESMNYADLEALHAAIGDGHVSAQLGRASAWPASCAAATTRSSCRPPRASPGAGPARRQSVGVYVEGLDDVMIRLSRCCTPVPGDEIIGFVTRGRGVSVHRADCANALSLTTGGDSARASSRSSGTASAPACSSCRSRSRRSTAPGCSPTWPGCCPSTTSTSSPSSTAAGSDRVSRMRFDFELADPAHLDSLLAAIKRIDSVYDAYRVLPGKGS